MNVTFKHPVAVAIALITIVSIPAWILLDKPLYVAIDSVIFGIAFGYAFRNPRDPNVDLRPDGTKKDLFDRI